MSSAYVGEPPVTSSELRPLLSQLHGEAIWLASAALGGLGLILIQIVGAYRDPSDAVVPCLALYGLLGVALALRKVSDVVVAITLVTGCLAVSLLLAAVVGLGAAIVLLVLPVGLAAVLIAIRAGLLTAAACTLLLAYAPPTLVPASAELRAFTTIGIWSTVGLIWLTLRPLLTVLQWSWSSYEQSHRLLEQARDHQVQLSQALQDLADANLQLTRLNRLGQALQQAAEEARGAKEEFVANVSHELRTPLNMIIGFGEMIVKAPQAYGDRIPPALLADLSVILRNSRHLSSLVDDVLDLSQIEARRMALTKERVVLPEIVEAAAEAVRPLFVSKGLELRTEVPDDLPLVFCDRTRIREVILNLLSNAGRFTDHGEVHVRAWQEVRDVVVSVTDTGPGIAANDLDRVFKPFQQLDPSLSRRYGGSGLGLSISNAFVDLHGGKMWLDSQVGRGTTFYFRLPVDPPAVVTRGALTWLRPDWEFAQRTRQSRVPAAVVRPRLVVVEEGDSLGRLLRRYLDGAEVVSASGLPEALSEMSRVPAQALLINDVSVDQALRRIEALPLPDGTPAIACAIPEPQQAATALGIDDYLLKPVLTDRLLAALDRLPIRGGTVLVVDDDPEARRLFQRMLGSAQRGYRVLEASDGEHGLNILREQRPDVVLLDLVMPELDGFRFLEARAKDPTLCDIPVVVISARDPGGQTIVSRALAVTRGGGLSTSHLLACVEALSRILGPMEQAGDPTPTETPPG